MIWRIWKFTGWDVLGTWAKFRQWVLKHCPGTGWRN